MNAAMATRGTGNETYFDSAEGLQLSRARALVELKRHGITDAAEINQFFLEMGPRETFDAQAVLIWLGY